MKDKTKSTIGVVLVVFVIAAIFTGFGFAIYYGLKKDKTSISGSTTSISSTSNLRSTSSTSMGVGSTSNLRSTSSTSMGVGSTSTVSSTSSTSMGVGSTSTVSSTSSTSMDNSSNTIRQRLETACPLDPTANGKIAVGNIAMRDDYLFSACKEYESCDLTEEPDEISNRIINMKKPNESCGSWLLNQDPNQIQIEYDNNTKSWKILTVRDRLNNTCPVDPTAGDKINPTNGATRIDYLYSSCTADNTCDSTGEPNEITNRIINMNKSQEHCGAWVLDSDPNQIKIVYNNNTKSWSRMDPI